MAPALEAIGKYQINFARRFEAVFQPLQAQFAELDRVAKMIAEATAPATELADRITTLFAGLDWEAIANQSRVVGAELDIRWAVEDVPEKVKPVRDVVYDAMALLSFLVALIAIGMFQSDAQRAEALSLCEGERKQQGAFGGAAGSRPEIGRASTVRVHHGGQARPGLRPEDPQGTAAHKRGRKEGREGRRQREEATRPTPESGL